MSNKVLHKRNSTLVGPRSYSIHLHCFNHKILVFPNVICLTFLSATYSTWKQLPLFTHAVLFYFVITIPK